MNVIEIIQGIRQDIPFQELSEIRDAIQEAVRRQREYQKMQWSAQHESDKTKADWITDMVHYLGRCSAPVIPKTEYIRCMVKVMALAMASIEGIGD
jgi:hypothetical protein